MMSMCEVSFFNSYESFCSMTLKNNIKMRPQKGCESQNHLGLNLNLRSSLTKCFRAGVPTVLSKEIQISTWIICEFFVAIVNISRCIDDIY